jgi:hypothetical protein
VTGKPALADLRARKKSLPVAAALAAGGPAAVRLRDWLATPAPPPDQTVDDLAELRGIAGLVEEAGGRAWAAAEARRQVLLAEQALARAPVDPAAATELVALARSLLGRVGVTATTPVAPGEPGRAARAGTRVADRGAAGRPVDAAIASAVAHLSGLQDEAGWWKGDLETNVTMDAEDLLLRHVLGILEPDDTARAARWIRSQQRADGSWATFGGGPADLSTTVEAWVALRLAGDPADAPHMRAAAEFARSKGGVAATGCSPGSGCRWSGCGRGTTCRRSRRRSCCCRGGCR